jgi:hypothetical protein
VWQGENKNKGPQHMADMLTTYKETVEEFCSSVAD